MALSRSVFNQAAGEKLSEACYNLVFSAFGGWFRNSVGVHLSGKQLRKFGCYVKNSYTLFHDHEAYV